MKNHDLVWLRSHLGLTQEQLGALIGVNRKTITRWEAGDVPMPARKWKALLKASETEQAQIPKQAPSSPVLADETPDETAETEEDTEYPPVYREAYVIAVELALSFSALRAKGFATDSPEIKPLSTRFIAQLNILCRLEGECDLPHLEWTSVLRIPPAPWLGCVDDLV
jgi:DNA-binding XRE family transcriptional regulator